MKIFCLVSGNSEVEKKLVCHIDQRGHLVTNLSLIKSAFNKDEVSPATVLFEKTLEAISNSDFVVAEISEPTAEAGFCIGFALSRRNIPIISFVNKKRHTDLNFFLSGITSHAFHLKQYDTFDKITAQLSLFGI